MTTSFIWWEKTVEYAFVLHTKKSLDFAAPLAGTHERAGDGIFASDSKLLLVEFKRNLDAVSSEREKFSDFDNAASVLSSRDAHHFIVYGHEVDIEEGKTPHLGIAARTYFSCSPFDEVDSMFAHGVGIDDFNAYLKEFLLLKLPDGRSTGSVSPASYASVYGLSKDREVTSVSMEQYLVHELKYVISLEPPQNSYDFTPGM